MLDRRIIVSVAVLLSVIVVAGVYGTEYLGALVLTAVVSGILLVLLRRFSDQPDFVSKVFFVALGARLLFGLLLYAFDLQSFFGGDAVTYHFRGQLLSDYWLGIIPADSSELAKATSVAGPGWGMTYFVGVIYLLTGGSFLAAQSVAGVFGAATAPLVYLCANQVFENRQVSRMSAYFIALFPAFVIWSGQLLKDGLIVFLLVLVMLLVLRLQQKFSYLAIVILILALGGIISLRFYIFYMVAAAVAGSFVIGTSSTRGSLFRRVSALIIAGVALTYLGVVRTATTDFDKYGDLERIQVSRQDLARSADSGFGEDVDVSTTAGAITAIPIGFAVLMLAPFPWQFSSFRQSITIPEVLLWWFLLPMMCWGIWYAIKHKLRSAFPILVFSGMLTLAYSIFQGNVGTAYRQRTQIQVFLFMFISVGWVLLKEKREDRKLINQAKRKRVDPIFTPEASSYR